MSTTPTLPPPAPAITPPLERDPFAGQVILQLYRGAMRSRDELRRDLDVIQRDLKHRTVCLHGFPRELRAAWEGLAGECSQRQLAAIASWGLDGTQDNDGSKLTSREKGLLMGDVAARADCAATLEDAEGRWDPGGTQDREGPTEVGMLEMGAALRERAPAAIVGDQPWPWITSHAGVRTTAAPLEAGGTIRGFPVDEAGAHVQWGRFRQFYWEDWTRPDAYVFVGGRMVASWAAIAPALQALGVERPLRVTLQGYGHERDPQYFAHSLLRFQVQLQQPVVVWCSPFPPALSLAILRAVDLLVHEGHAGPGIDPLDAVRAFQTEHNRLAPSEKQLVVDGWLGRKSLEALGFAL